MNYEWDFGDGTTGSGINPSHAYTAPGTYTVALTVTDFALQETTYTTTVTVAVGDPPVAKPGGPYETYVDLPIRFNGSGSTDDNGIARFLWSVGNQETLLQDSFAGTVLDSSKWLYQISGVTQNEAVTLTGGSTWGSRFLFSSNNFAVDASTVIQGQVNHTVSGHLMFGFKDTGTNYQYNAMPYALYFDAGTLRVYESGNNRAIVGSYSLNTLYDVKIALKGSAPGMMFGAVGGAKYYYKAATSTVWILLYDSNYVPAYTSMKVGVSYYSGTFIVDNMMLTRGTIELTGERPVAVMGEVGSFSLQLTVSDGANQSHTASTTITVSDDPAVVTVPWQFSGGIEVPHDTWSGEEVILKAVVKSRHAPLSYTWEFGDGTSTSGTVSNKYDVSARHTYSAASGTPFVARLIVTDADGRTSSRIPSRSSCAIKPSMLRSIRRIDDALWYLHTTQDRAGSTTDGSWHNSNYPSNYHSSQTASSIHSMEINGHLEVGDFGK